MITDKLRRSTIRQLGGRESLRDVAEHGAAGGFHGFIYYHETVAFYRRNRADILALASDMAAEFGQDVISFVAGFGCLTDDRETRDEIGRTLYGRMTDDDCLVANALAWFALEEVAREAHL